MKPDDDLNQLLRRARVPEREPEFWAEFPTRVLRETRRGARPHAGSVAPHLWKWKVGLVAGCVAVGFFILLQGHHTDTRASSDMEPARKLFHELGLEFAGRLRGVVLEGNEVRLLLRDAGPVSPGSPLWVRICSGQDCRTVIMFSGERFRLNGDEYDVLAGTHGEIFVVGSRFVWSSSSPRNLTAGLAIEARTLEAPL